MVFKLYSDVRETSTTGGTGDQVLTGVAFDPSYFRFNDRYANADTFFYCMRQGGLREIGLGTRVASGDKVSRTQVYKSTNANALVNFSAGQTVDIFVTNVAPDDLDAAGRLLSASANGVPALAGLNTFTDTTDSSSSTAGGAFTVAGGMAVAKKLFVGGQTNVGQGGTGANVADIRLAGGSGTAGGSLISFMRGTSSEILFAHESRIFGTSSGKLTLYDTTYGAIFTIDPSTRSMALGSTTASTSTTTGALTVAGGVGVAGGLNVGAASKFSIAGTDLLVSIEVSATGGTAGIDLRRAGVSKWQLTSASLGGVNDRLTITNAAGGAGVFMNQGDTSWSAYSDRRVKRDVETLSVLDRIDAFRAVRYTSNISGKAEIGFIAQEQAEAWPELVRPGTDDDDGAAIVSTTDARMWSGIYDRWGVVALQGVKELHALVRAQQATIEALTLHPTV